MSPNLPQRVFPAALPVAVRTTQHCAGVQSLALTPDGGQLFTASRDSTIKRWAVTPQAAAAAAAPGGGDAPRSPPPVPPPVPPSASFLQVLRGHTDWVNDVVLLGRDHLVSCSSDNTVKLWRAASGERERGSAVGEEGGRRRGGEEEEMRRGRRRLGWQAG